MAVVNAGLTAGYDDLEVVLVRLVKETNLTMLQILDGWHKSRSCTVNGINHWNHYTKYAMRHEEQERRRLGLLTDVPRKSRLFPSQLYVLPANIFQLHPAFVASCTRSSSKTTLKLGRRSWRSMTWLSMYNPPPRLLLSMHKPSTRSRSESYPSYVLVSSLMSNLDDVC